MFKSYKCFSHIQLNKRLSFTIKQIIENSKKYFNTSSVRDRDFNRFKPKIIEIVFISQSKLIVYQTNILDLKFLAFNWFDLIKESLLLIQLIFVAIHFDFDSHHQFIETRCWIDN